MFYPASFKRTGININSKYVSMKQLSLVQENSKLTLVLAKNVLVPIA